MEPDPRGRLVLAGTHLGNPGDASSRLGELLSQADLVAAEDTRRLRRLLRDLGVQREGPVISFYEDVEAERLPRLLEVLGGGGTVALVTDAGMPSISDPGYRAARAALAAGHDLAVLPGPSAVTAALALSGLPTDRFCFEGFLPRRAGQRRARLAELAAEPRTQVYFESPRRLDKTLADMGTALGWQRSAAVCRELTKTYEEVRRGTLAELAEWAGAGVRGEITLVVSGFADPSASQERGGSGPDLAAAVDRVAELLAAGQRPNEAIKEVARRSGVRRQDLYEEVTRRRKP